MIKNSLKRTFLSLALPDLRFRAAHVLYAALLCITVFPIPGLAQPATEPLLTRGAAVRPNLLLVLDDSGSMNGGQVYARHYVVATDSCDDDKFANQSPINNLLYYNPAKRYEPGFSNTGTQLANASVPSGGGWNNLDIYTPQAGQSAAIPNLTTKTSICKANRYDEITVERSKFTLNGADTSTNPFTYNANRTDCAANPCTLPEEKQNITNWRTYHNTRLKAAKTGVARAFTAQPDTFRVGYTTIHVGNANGSGSGNLKLNGVKDYYLAKTDFYTWLNDLSASGDTPLRKALDITGQYYSRIDNNGPWAHSPWLSNSEGETSAQHLSCRRNFTIMVTDGEWNGAAASTAGARLNVDGTTASEITHADGILKYKYTPRSTDIRSKGKADTVAGSLADFDDTLADVAMHYWVRDLRSGPDNVALANNVTPGKSTDKPFWQNMTTYTAAFGPVGKLTAAQVTQAKDGQINWTAARPTANAAATIDDLIHAAHNGGGEFLTLTDAASFASELGRVVGSIAGEQFSQAGVAASAVTLTAGTKKFVPYFTSNLWWGNVKMINLLANGDESNVAWEVIETDNLGKPTGNSKIKSPTTRDIYTWTPADKGFDFKMIPLVAKGLIAPSAASNTSTLLHNTVNSDIVNYLRGDRSMEGSTLQFRPREAVLGDIVNSTPVFIKNNSDFGYQRLSAATPGQSDYAAYMTGKSDRTEGVLFIGANDGMVHGFREGSASTVGGSETFAYLPQAVLGNMHLLASKTYQHRFYVDGPMAESDAYISAPNGGGGPGNTTRWANLVLGTTGAGARSVFALDATSPLNMNARSILWEINQTTAGMADLGHVMSQVETGITASGDWVAIFGNGPYGNSGRASLFVVNLATGQLLKKIDTDTSTGNGLGGTRLVRNAQGMIIGAYAGDLKGNVWRFDLNASVQTLWPSAGQLLFTAKDNSNNPQAITASPGVVPRTDKPGYMVILGTGKLYDLNDQSSTQVQAAYGLWDTVPFGSSGTFSPIVGKSSLVQVSVTTTNVSSTTTVGSEPTTFYNAVAARAMNWDAGDRGWFLNYELTPGQRTIFSVEPVQKVVRVDTIAPRLSQQSCSAGTSLGFNYILDPLAGTCRAQSTFDTNGDGKIDSDDSRACVYSTEADGEDVVLDIRLNGVSTGFIDIQDSRGHIKARVGDDLPPTGSPGVPGLNVKRSWRQLIMR